MRTSPDLTAWIAAREDMEKKAVALAAAEAAHDTAFRARTYAQAAYDSAWRAFKQATYLEAEGDE